jgi:hypothetical protein
MLLARLTGHTHPGAGLRQQVRAGTVKGVDSLRSLVRFPIAPLLNARAWRRQHEVGSCFPPSAWSQPVGVITISAAAAVTVAATLAATLDDRKVVNF